MRWEGQAVDSEDPLALPGLSKIAGFVRSTRTPEFAGVTFHEVLCKSALNRVPARSDMPFDWTVNPTRGCLHQCTYCFARRTHEYLDFDSGRDFDTQIIVKTNVAEVLRRELARPSWRREHVALGTNSDPYMRAEGRYRLMPGIISALADSGTPFSILTKGPLLKRDLPLLAAAARSVPVSIGVSLAFLDPGLQQRVEPGTPAPKARLDLVRTIAETGLDVSVMAMPVLPWLTDSDTHLDELFGRLAAAGASRVTAGALHLRPGSREWFLQWLARDYPQLVDRYRQLYAGGTYASKEYRQWLAGRVAFFRSRHRFAGPARGLRGGTAGRDRRPAGVPPAPSASRNTAEPTLF
ncbi:Rv2578c family radical SAM protein [Arthrobacter sp. I2-34]|uniref:Rv2578c family radical SAM protein n=1 Tax=Arthrobacter hankyongi TaxID=2904801 RepID=A0ABS9L0Z5_9MICC|nr:Rv2578c family radical SAM protein [Arthrobacter hankyongi]MCG2620311.1 Rv2578c family radical SAM protein [Arthrobacter hankyongi]